MRFQYTKQNKGKNVGVFVQVGENEKFLESSEKAESKDDSLEDWHNVVVSEREEDCNQKSSNSSDDANSTAEIKE